MPRAGWKKPVSDRRLSDLVSVGVLTRVFPPALVDEVIAGAGRTEQRNRSLPARVMAYFAIGMAMHSEGSYADVLSQLTDGLAWSSGWADSYSPPSKSAIFQARQRLGSEPMKGAPSRGELIPTFMDSRIARWVHRQVQILRTRAACLQEQAVTVPDLPAEARNGRTRSSGRDSSRDPSVLLPDKALPLIKDEEPRPSNRAERRAQERHVNRQGRTNQ